MKKQEEGKKGTMKGRKERMRRRRKRALPDNPGNPFKCKGEKNNVKCKVTWLLTPKGTALKDGTKFRVCGTLSPFRTHLNCCTLGIKSANAFTSSWECSDVHVSPHSKVRIQTMFLHTLTPGWHMNDLLLGLHSSVSTYSKNAVGDVVSLLYHFFFKNAPPLKPSNEIRLTVTRTFLLRSQEFLNEGGEKEGRLLSSQIKSQSASQRIKQIRTPSGEGFTVMRDSWCGHLPERRENFR